jgi:hypothetical protein
MNIYSLYYESIFITEYEGGEIMPNRDGTGPKGKGPKTGRKKGKCK